MAKQSTGSADGLTTYIRRELNGATFLTLEHIAHMALTLVVGGLIAMGLIVLLDMATGSSLGLLILPGPLLAVSNLIGVSVVLVLAAALVVLSPFLYVLERRTSAEIAKRPGFEKRLAYKAPLYIALGVNWLVMLGMIIILVSGLLQWLVAYFNQDYQMLTASLLTPLVVLLVFAITGWNLIRLAQGKQTGLMFNSLLTVVGEAVAVALIVGMVMVVGYALPMSPTNYFMQDSYPVDDLFSI